MEIHKINHILDNLLKILNNNKSKSDSSAKQNKSDRRPQDFKLEFSFQLQGKVEVLKAGLAQMVKKIMKSEDIQPLTSIQINMLKIILSKMSFLNRGCLYLLDEGIVILYQDINALQNTCQKSKIRLWIKNVLKQFKVQLKPLLWDYFIYQQYLRKKQQQIKQRNELQLDLWVKQNGNQQNIGYDIGLIRQIQKDIKNTPIRQLLKKQVKNYENEMRNASQICRICFNKVLLDKIEYHVKICQKQNTLKQNVEQKKYQLHHLKLNLKQKCEEINQKNTSTQYDLQFKKIARLIINFNKNQKNANRRCSLITSRSDKIFGNIQNIIQDFIDQNGSDPLLSKIYDTYKEKQYLEKKINNLEINNSLQRKLSAKIQNKQIQLPSTVLKLARAYSSNNTANKQKSDQVKHQSQDSATEDQYSENQQNIIKSGQSHSINDLFDYKLQKSKKCLSKNALKNDVLTAIWDQKQYSSLQEIIDNSNRKQISLNNFQILRVLGQGAFGKVYMVKRKETSDIYALKIIKIPEDNNDISAIKKQHDIFKKIAGQHLVKAPFSFSQKNCHIFILEYLPGGDLRKLLNEQVYFQEDRAKMYLAQIILAIEHLHKFDIIHRDLKPENLVFDKFGHLKLTDFGLSEFQMNQKLQKTCKQSQKNIKKIRKRRQAVLNNDKQKMKLIGTPDYIAPQIIFKTSLNNFSIDWWSLGVMAYELIIGTRPFCAESIEEVIDNITNFKIDWPEVGDEEGMISFLAKDLICQLLNKDFMHRLGANGADEIKNHPFFEGVCWETVKSKAPMVLPKMTNIKDCIGIQEDGALRKQIDQFLNKGEKKNVDLQKFVRFDLLGTETLQNFQKVHQNKNKKLRTLRTLEESFLVEEQLES